MRAVACLITNALLALTGCASTSPPEYFGTTDPFASEAIYFVVTDRFVNGDTSNDHRDQGGEYRSFDRPFYGPNGEVDNLGYLGGDFKGIVDHASYIREMGFSAVWITPVVDNPSQAFTGGNEVKWGSILTDRGKSGYHGYWGVNFYRLDEHLPSPGLDFRAFTRQMSESGLKVVLDIVANHGSPSFTMPADQPEFGEVYSADGKLLADHQNLPPEHLDPKSNSLHRFFHAERDLAQLSNFDDTSPEVRDYVIGSVLQWLDQGAAALRIDTIRHMPHSFWKHFSDRVRTEHPGLFMFGESFEYDANKIAPHTWAENGGISVLDFPLQKKLVEVFSTDDGDFAALGPALFLENGPYHNPYELMTFYDNHDVARFNADDDGFIDVHNWLFTARGIPVVYYGSEIGFMRGRAEHAGNRNYFGEQNIAAARTHAIREQLARVAKLRASTPALQRGLQVNVKLQEDEAVFYRVYQRDDTNQIALVMLNKSDTSRRMEVSEYVEAGAWRDAFTGTVERVGDRLVAEVPAHGLRVFVRDAPVTREDFHSQLQQSQHGRSTRLRAED